MRNMYMDLRKVRAGDVILTRGNMLPAACLSAGPYTHAEIAISRLLRFGSTPRHGIRVYPAEIVALKDEAGAIHYVEKIETRRLGLARMNWPHEFRFPTTPTAPTTYKELSRQLQMFLVNLEHDKFYPEYRTLLDAEDVRSRHPWITPRHSPLRWLIRRLDRFTGRSNASGRQAPSSAMEVGGYCSKAAVDALRHPESTVPRAWRSSSISPNEITRLCGIEHHSAVALDVTKLQKAPQASAAANSALATVVHNLVLPDNGVIQRLQDSLTEIEHSDPFTFRAITDWYLCLHKPPSLSDAIEHLRKTAQHHLWSLEDHLLGAHPSP
jgi:hypothetical protein